MLGCQFATNCPSVLCCDDVRGGRSGVNSDGRVSSDREKFVKTKLRAKGVTVVRRSSELRGLLSCQLSVKVGRHRVLVATYTAD